MRYVMRLSPTSLRLSVWALAVTLALSGCGKSSKPASNAVNPEQPATPSSPATGTQTQPATQPAAAQNAPAPPPTPVVVPTGTPIRVRLDEAVGSKISQPGEKFHATVADEVLVNGLDLIPQGSHAEGTVIDAKPLGHFKGGALLELRLERVRTDSGSYTVATSTMVRTEKGKGTRTAKFAGGGGA